jgi:photosystem II stability/assembly factor-like uncharacterized protein
MRREAAHGDRGRRPPVAALLALAWLAVAAPAAAAESVPLAAVSHIHGVAFDREDPQRLLLATHHGLYVASSDGTARRLSEHRDDLMGFSPHPSEPSTLYASGHPETGGNLGVVRSQDGGVSWERLAPGVHGPVDFHAMTISPADPGVLYGAYRGLQASRDGGRSWEMVGPAPSGLIALAASARDPDRLFAATEQGLLVSDDSGRAWRPGHLLRRPVTTVAVAPDGTVYAWMLGVGLLRGAEPALRFERVHEGEGDGYLLHLSIDPADPLRLAAVDRQGGLLLSDDGGRSWHPFGG